MPYNGSGVYSPVAPPNFPAVPGTTIRSAAYNAQINDIASALTNVVTRDGQSPATADLPMGGFKFTGVGVPTGNGEAYRWEQLIQGADLASAAELPVPAEGQYFVVTGAVTITSFTGQTAGRVIYLRFPAGITLTHSADLILPLADDVATEAGDVAAFVAEAGTVWRCVSYPRVERSKAALDAAAALAAANAAQVTANAAVPKAGGTMTGNLVVGSATYQTDGNIIAAGLPGGNLVSALAGKQNVLGYAPVNKTGDTMTGNLTVGSATHATDGNIIAAGLSGGNLFTALAGKQAAGSYATAGSTCPHTTVVVEFGIIGTDAPAPSSTVDLPSPYVMVGLRHPGGQGALYLRGVQLRNQ